MSADRDLAPAKRIEEPLTITQPADDTITLGCSVCGAEVRSDCEPTSALLDAVQKFAEAHANCG